MNQNKVKVKLLRDFEAYFRKFKEGEEVILNSHPMERGSRWAKSGKHYIVECYGHGMFIPYEVGVDVEIIERIK